MDGAGPGSDLDPDSDALARAARVRRLLIALGVLAVVLLTVGTSLIFAGAPGIGMGTVAMSVLVAVGAITIAVRWSPSDD